MGRVERLTAAFVLALATNAFVYLATGVSLAITRQIPARDALHMADRLGVAYLPAAIVGIVVAAFGSSGGRGGERPRSWRRSSRSGRRSSSSTRCSPERASGILPT